MCNLMRFANRDVSSKSHLEQLFQSTSLLMETKHAIKNKEGKTSAAVPVLMYSSLWFSSLESHKSPGSYNCFSK